MAIEIEPPEPDLPNIRKRSRHARRCGGCAAGAAPRAVALAAWRSPAQTETGSERLQLALRAVTSEPTAPSPPQMCRRARPACRNRNRCVSKRSCACSPPTATGCRAHRRARAQSRRHHRLDQAAGRAGDAVPAAKPPIRAACDRSGRRSQPPPRRRRPSCHDRAAGDAGRTDSAAPCHRRQRAATPAAEPVPLPPTPHRVRAGERAGGRAAAQARIRHRSRRRAERRSAARALGGGEGAISARCWKACIRSCVARATPGRRRVAAGGRAAAECRRRGATLRHASPPPRRPAGRPVRRPAAGPR